VENQDLFKHSWHASLTNAYFSNTPKGSPFLSASEVTTAAAARSGFERQTASTEDEAYYFEYQRAFQQQKHQNRVNYAYNNPHDGTTQKSIIDKITPNILKMAPNKSGSSRH
jgi:hypothetical protein